MNKVLHKYKTSKCPRLTALLSVVSGDVSWRESNNNGGVMIDY